jgi:mycothiol synthase
MKIRRMDTAAMLAGVPPGFVVRRPSADDAGAVAALGIAQDIDDLGEADYTLDDVLAEWEDVDLATDAWIVHTDAGDPAAYAGLDGDDGRVFTDPRLKGRGLGDHLAGLLEDRAREKGFDLIGQMAFGGNDAARELLAARGYVVEQNYWRMRIDVGPDTPDPELDARRYDPGRDEPAVHALIQHAFAEVPGFHEQDIDAWRLQWGTPDRLALSTLVERDGELIGVSTTGVLEGRGWISHLAVDPDARGSGLGRSLLLASFAAARDAGLTSVGLDVNAANSNAARLYESAGMRVEWHSDRWEKRL